MKHSVHIGIGKEFSKFFDQLSEHVFTLNDEVLNDHFSPLVIYQKDNDEIVIEAFSQAEHANHIQNDKNLTAKDVVVASTTFNSEDQLKEYFNTLYNRMINITTVQNVADLKFCIYIQLWESQLIKNAVQLIKLISGNGNDLTIDLVGLTHDLRSAFYDDSDVEEKNNESLNTLEKTVRTNIKFILNELDSNIPTVNHFIILQNKQINGISLNLNFESLTRIFSEFTQIYIEHYSKLFQNIARTENQITGIGFSAIVFNKRYFVDYLISKTYVHILNNEGINTKSADVNKLANQVNGVLIKRYGNQINFLTNFWSEHIDEKVNTGTPYHTILQDINPIIDTHILNLSKELLEFLDNDSLTLPEKRAGIASLLGEDDELFEGQVYDPDIPIIDDCEYEQANFFVQMNNHISEMKDEELSQYASLQSVTGDGKSVIIPLKEIKTLKTQIRNSTQTIRSFEKRIDIIAESIEKNEVSDKVLIDRNFIKIGDKKFRITEKPIEEQLLEDFYKPRNSYPGEIDLRDRFPVAKNQGTIGACSAFATVSVFEYLSNLAGKNVSYNENFVYYMARLYDGKTETDTGTSIFNAIKALSEFGVCENDEWNNNGNIIEEPDSQTKEKAQKNKVIKALNVNHTLHDLKSAISEGYPVCFGLKIYESFGNPVMGFITSPLQDEINNDNSGYHSMVLCGYSDIAKVFIVRNSWGKNYGDNGYCYIPYSYIEDSKYFVQAFVIVEISIGNPLIRQAKTVVNFDTTDKLIEYAITKNLLGEEENDLRKFKKSYENHKKDYLNIITKLTSILFRNQLVEGENLYLGKKLQFAEDEKLKTLEKRELNLKKVQSKTAKIFNWSIFFILGIVTLIITAFSLLKFWDVFLSKYLWIGIIISAFIFLFLSLWKVFRNKIYKKRNDYWIEAVNQADIEINQIKQDIEILKLKSNIAGQLHMKIFELKQSILNKHQILKSFVGNLKEWYKIEEKAIQEFSPTMNFPFINIINNNDLDLFFEQRVNEVVNDLRLIDFIQKYELTESGIEVFKDDLRRTIYNRLYSYLDNFNMYDFVAEKTVYPYLTYETGDITNHLQKIKNMSKVFLHTKSHAVNSESNNWLAINKTDNIHSSQWTQAIEQVFNMPPIEITLNAKNKIVMIQILELDASDLKFMN